MTERWVCKRCYAANDGTATSCTRCGLLRGSEVPAPAPGQAPWQPMAAAAPPQPAWRRLLRFWWIPVVGAVLVVGFLSTARRDDSGAITDAGTVDINELQVGDCFDSAEVEEITQVDGKPCDQPHEYELFHVATWTGSDEYPPESDMEQLIVAECLPAFDAFVGRTYQESVLDIFWTAPTAEGWSDGDRIFQCAIYDPGNAQLTASVRGSGR